jgi:hypothetical protein
MGGGRLPPLDVLAPRQRGMKARPNETAFRPSGKISASVAAADRGSCLIMIA